MIQEDGEDEWEWERATAREAATAAERRPSAAHAKRKRACEAEFITAEWLETRSAQWRELALRKRVRRGEPITTERYDRACFVALHSTASGVRVSLALARRAVDPPPPTKRRSRRPSEAPRAKEPRRVVTARALDQIHALVRVRANPSPNPSPNPGPDPNPNPDPAPPAAGGRTHLGK